MTKTNNGKANKGAASAPTKSLADVLAAVERIGTLSRSRRRDLRSAVTRVAALLGNIPSGVVLDLPTISSRLATVNPLAVGMTAKRYANIRSDFLAAVKASNLVAITSWRKIPLAPVWRRLFATLSGKRAHLGLSRFARYASVRGIAPDEVDDSIIADFIAATREQSLHTAPNLLHRQVAQIWNEAARVAGSRLKVVAVPSFRGPPKRIDWSSLPSSFRQDVQKFLDWSGQSDAFALDTRARRLGPETLRLRRDQIHAAVSALVFSGTQLSAIRSLRDLVTPANFTKILQRRVEMVRGERNSFNQSLGIALALIAREWVKVDPDVHAKLKQILSKLPVPRKGLTDKNKRFLRQFDDPRTLLRLVQLPERLWAEVKREKSPTYRTLAKAQAALAIAILTYIPIRLKNLQNLEFDTHLFVRTGRGAVSTLELSDSEVKNDIDVAFDIPPRVVQMLLDYRERIAPKIIGRRPKKLFVNINGDPKIGQGLSMLITNYAKRRAGITLTAHEFRHLSAKIILDDQPGAFETVRQLLAHKNLQTTVFSYTGIDSRRAGRHHHALVEAALAVQAPRRSRGRPERQSRGRK